MLLALDIGNSSIGVGLFEGERLSLRAKLSVDRKRTADEYAVILCTLLGERGAQVTEAVIGSVEPRLTHTLETAVARLGSADALIPILHIGGGVRTGISLRVDDPTSLGADIVTNAAAAVALYGAPVVFFDYGTATVAGAVNAARELVGVTITPGLAASLDALREAAALIPYVELKAPASTLGKSTAAAVSSGVVVGTAAMTDGLIDRIRDELGLPPDTPLPVVATGGLAPLVVPACRYPLYHEPDLTLYGLAHIYRATAEREARMKKKS